ncbi:MAG: BON domain-containing protein [Alphaproteobacteria bacterium]|nr:BON domain-containing protein [Alphaproteobacteria bacterium]MCB9746704.1 BON domain-containing protein [Alphaproteobacteria bacterium]MCB9759965.1 BON domain-containing protein [Alphaproteobacteria bacterium]
MRASLRGFLLALALLLLAALPGALRADEDNVRDVVVVVRKQVAVEIPYRFGNVALGADIVKVVPLRDSQQLLLSGRVEGTTNLMIYDTRGVLRDELDVTVIPANLDRVMSSVQALLDDVEGLSFKIINDRVYIQGEVSLDEELSRVQELADREPLVESMVTLSPVAQRLIAGLIEQEIDEPGIHARLVNNRIILEGVAHSEAQMARAEAIARAYYPDVVNVLDLREVERIPGRARTLVVVVHFVELAKSLTHSWGIEWTPLALDDAEAFFQRDYGADGWAAATGYATATVSAFLPRLDQARSSGYARVLENPTVSVKSGDTATIFAGAEYPFLVNQGLSNTIEFKDIGIKLDVTPYAHGNNVDMDIGVTVTSLGEIAPNGYQSINKSELSTSQFCRAGESIVIGGLQRIQDSVDYNRVPYDAPEGGVFTLYRNKSYKKAKSQFLIFLTPQIHESSSSANREIKDQFHLDEVRQ